MAIGLLTRARDLAHHINHRLRAPLLLRQYLAGPPPHRLHVGCGGNLLDGWLNTDYQPQRDVMYLDATGMVGIPDESFDAVFCEHMIEHLPLPDAQALLAGLHRVLKPGARIRVVTPSLDAFCAMVLQPSVGRDYLDWFRNFRSCPTADEVDAINAIFYEHGHRFIWSARRLGAALVAAGFVTPETYPAGESTEPDFQGIDRHGAVIGSELANRLESCAVEAIKPLGGARGGG